MPIMIFSQVAKFGHHPLVTTALVFTYYFQEKQLPDLNQLFNIRVIEHLLEKFLRKLIKYS